MSKLFNKQKILTNEFQSLELLIKAPLYNSISTFEEICKFLDYLNKNKYNILKNIYFNMENIHKIIYSEEEEIKVDSYEIKKDLNCYFYLSLLILDNFETVNYKYNFSFINDIYNTYKNEEKKLKKIIIIKIILILIKNYEGLDNDEENNKDDIKKECVEIIKNNIDILKEYNINIGIEDLIKIETDKLYIDIINSLIKLKKFDNFDYIINIINELDLENIDITQTMLKELVITLNAKESYMIDYLISNKDDLFNEKKINFYFLLIKYILKNSIYIYQIPLLLSIRIFILKLLKSNQIEYNNINGKNKEKIQYIIRLFADSEYYLINNSSSSPIKEVLKYYKVFLFETKKEEIEKIENNEGDCDIYLEDLEIAQKMNKRAPIINYLYNCFNKDNKNPKTEEDFTQMVKKWNEIEKIINDKKKTKMRNDDKGYLIEFFNDINNKKFLYNIFKEDALKFLFEHFKTRIQEIKEGEEWKLNIPKYMMNNSSITIYTNKKGNEPYIIYEKILYGVFETEIDYNELVNNKDDFIKNNKNENIINNYKKFFEFLEQFIDEIKKEFKYNYKLKINLEFIMEKQNEMNDDSNYNITCTYTFYAPIENKEFKFKDDNIIVNGINSKSEGFKNLISTINDEAYKEVNYK